MLVEKILWEYKSQLLGHWKCCWCELVPAVTAVRCVSAGAEVRPAEPAHLVEPRRVDLAGCYADQAA